MTGTLVSQLCGVVLQVSGLIYNDAEDTTKAFVYSIILLAFEIVGVIASLRLLLSANTPQRATKLSHVSFLLQMIYDFCLCGYHMLFIGQVPEASQVLSLVGAVVLVIGVILDTMLFNYALAARRHRLRL